jgi:hypothetical protein
MVPAPHLRREEEKEEEGMTGPLPPPRTRMGIAHLLVASGDDDSMRAALLPTPPLPCCRRLVLVALQGLHYIMAFSR